MLLREFEKALNLADGVGLDYGLRHKPKIRRVVGIGDAVNQAGVDAGGGEDLGELGVDVHNLICHSERLKGAKNLVLLSELHLKMRFFGRLVSIRPSGYSTNGSLTRACGTVQAE
jgi:hypothetical protein